MTCKNAWRKLGLTPKRMLLRPRLISGATVWARVRVGGGLWTHAVKLEFITGSIVRSATRRYLNYSVADFEVFRSAGGDTLHRWGWNLAGSLLYAKFHPHRGNDNGIGLQKVKFLLRFDQNVE